MTNENLGQSGSNEDNYKVVRDFENGESPESLSSMEQLSDRNACAIKSQLAFCGVLSNEMQKEIKRFEENDLKGSYDIFNSLEYYFSLEGAEKLELCEKQAFLYKAIEIPKGRNTILTHLDFFKQHYPPLEDLLILIFAYEYENEKEALSLVKKSGKESLTPEEWKKGMVPAISNLYEHRFSGSIQALTGMQSFESGGKSEFMKEEVFNYADQREAVVDLDFLSQNAEFLDISVLSPLYEKVLKSYPDQEKVFQFMLSVARKKPSIILSNFYLFKEAPWEKKVLVEECLKTKPEPNSISLLSSIILDETIDQALLIRYLEYWDKYAVLYTKEYDFFSLCSDISPKLGEAKINGKSVFELMKSIVENEEESYQHAYIFYSWSKFPRSLEILKLMVEKTEDRKEEKEEILRELLRNLYKIGDQNPKIIFDLYDTEMLENGIFENLTPTIFNYFEDSYIESILEKFTEESSPRIVYAFPIYAHLPKSLEILQKAVGMKEDKGIGWRAFQHNFVKILESATKNGKNLAPIFENLLVHSYSIAIRFWENLEMVKQNVKEEIPFSSLLLKAYPSVKFFEHYTEDTIRILVKYIPELVFQALENKKVAPEKTNLYLDMIYEKTNQDLFYQDFIFKNIEKIWTISPSFVNNILDPLEAKINTISSDDPENISTNKDLLTTQEKTTLNFLSSQRLSIPKLRERLDKLLLPISQSEGKKFINLSESLLRFETGSKEQRLDKLAQGVEKRTLLKSTDQGWSDRLYVSHLNSLFFDGWNSFSKDFDRAPVLVQRECLQKIVLSGKEYGWIFRKETRNFFVERLGEEFVTNMVLLAFTQTEMVHPGTNVDMSEILCNLVLLKTNAIALDVKLKILNLTLEVLRENPDLDTPPFIHDVIPPLLEKNPDHPGINQFLFKLARIVPNHILIFYEVILKSSQALEIFKTAIPNLKNKNEIKTAIIRFRYPHGKLKIASECLKLIATNFPEITIANFEIYNAITPAIEVLKMAIFSLKEPMEMPPESLDALFELETDEEELTKILVKLAELGSIFVLKNFDKYWDMEASESIIEIFFEHFEADKEIDSENFVKFLISKQKENKDKAAGLLRLSAKKMPLAVIGQVRQIEDEKLRKDLIEILKSNLSSSEVWTEDILNNMDSEMLEDLLLVQAPKNPKKAIEFFPIYYKKLGETKGLRILGKAISSVQPVYHILSRYEYAALFIVAKNPIYNDEINDLVFREVVKMAPNEVVEHFEEICALWNSSGEKTTLQFLIKQNFRQYLKDYKKLNYGENNPRKEVLTSHITPKHVFELLTDAQKQNFKTNLIQSFENNRVLKMRVSFPETSVEGGLIKTLRKKIEDRNVRQEIVDVLKDNDFPVNKFYRGDRIKIEEGDFIVLRANGKQQIVPLWGRYNSYLVNKQIVADVKQELEKNDFDPKALEIIARKLGRFEDSDSAKFVRKLKFTDQELEALLQDPKTKKKFQNFLDYFNPYCPSIMLEHYEVFKKHLDSFYFFMETACSYGYSEVLHGNNTKKILALNYGQDFVYLAVENACRNGVYLPALLGSAYLYKTEKLKDSLTKLWESAIRKSPKQLAEKLEAHQVENTFKEQGTLGDLQYLKERCKQEILTQEELHHFVRHNPRFSENHHKMTEDIDVRYYSVIKNEWISTNKNFKNLPYRFNPALRKKLNSMEYVKRRKLWISRYLAKRTDKSPKDITKEMVQEADYKIFERRYQVYHKSVFKDRHVVTYLTGGDLNFQKEKIRKTIEAQQSKSKEKSLNSCTGCVTKNDAEKAIVNTSAPMTFLYGGHSGLGGVGVEGLATLLIERWKKLKADGITPNDENRDILIIGGCFVSGDLRDILAKRMKNAGCPIPFMVAESEYGQGAFGNESGQKSKFGSQFLDRVVFDEEDPTRITTLGRMWVRKEEAYDDPDDPLNVNSPFYAPGEDGEVIQLSENEWFDGGDENLERVA